MWKPPAACRPPGLHTTARERKRGHFRARRFKNTTKIQRKDTQETEKSEHLWWDMEKRERNFGRSGGGAVRRRGAGSVGARKFWTNTHSRHTHTQQTHTHTADTDTHSRHRHTQQTQTHTADTDTHTADTDTHTADTDTHSRHRHTHSRHRHTHSKTQTHTQQTQTHTQQTQTHTHSRHRHTQQTDTHTADTHTADTHTADTHTADTDTQQTQTHTHRCRFFLSRVRFFNLSNVVFYFVPSVCFFCPVRFFFVPRVFAYFVPFPFFLSRCVFFCPATCCCVLLCVVVSPLQPLFEAAQSSPGGCERCDGEIKSLEAAINLFGPASVHGLY